MDTVVFKQSGGALNRMPKVEELTNPSITNAAELQENFDFYSSQSYSTIRLISSSNDT